MIHLYGSVVVTLDMIMKPQLCRKHRKEFSFTVLVELTQVYTQVLNNFTYG